MDYFLDMIHHNPGEALMDSAFRDPSHLKAYGFNGQAFKHINTVITFDAMAPGIFPATEEERTWLDQMTTLIEDEIAAAKAAGLSVYYHIDLFLLPKRLVDHFADRLLDPQTGRLSLTQPFILELHRALFEEMFRRFPAVDGLIIRVGETYLYDTPYHMGHGAVPYSTAIPVDDQISKFVQLLNFLREEVCVRHGKTVIHRTWDTWPNRFHANEAFYLRVTNQIEPHPNLLFSIKHTQLDFHRWVEFNPCLTKGTHRQVVEVQCQREYEGKGAYPNYAVYGIIEGFAEQRERKGLKDIIDHPLIAGIYTWSRGGGWYGPYVDRRNERWCDLNAYVIIHWAQNPAAGEAAIFMQYAREILGMNEGDAAIFRDIALRSLDAVVKGKCCAVYDRRETPEPALPTYQWMRDDVLQGMENLSFVFDYVLQQAGGVEEALQEKAECVELWEHLRERCRQFSADLRPDVREVIETSVEYGARLFRYIEAAWRVLLSVQHAAHTSKTMDRATLTRDLETYDRAWAEYEALPSTHPLSATLYRPQGWAWPEKPLPPGLSASIEQVRNSAKG